MDSEIELIQEADGKQVEDIWRWAKRQAITQMDLSLGARECWRIIEAFPPGRCYPSHFHIAETMHRKRSAVRRYLRELKKKRYVDIAPRYDAENTKRRRPRSSARPRGQTSNSYTLLDQPDLIAAAKQILQEWYAKQKRKSS